MDNRSNPVPAAPQPPQTPVGGVPKPLPPQPSAASAAQVSTLSSSIPGTTPVAQPSQINPQPPQTVQPVNAVNTSSGVQMPVPNMVGTTQIPSQAQETVTLSQTMPNRVSPPVPAPTQSLTGNTPPPQQIPPTANPSQGAVNQTPPPPPPVPPREASPTQENPSMNSDQGSGKSKKGIFKFIAIFVFLLMLIGGAVFAYFTFFNPNNPNRSSGADQNPSGQTPAREVVINYWGLWEPESIYREVFDEFEQQNPGVKIVYTLQSQADYRERLLSDLVRGAGPDIFRYHNTWVPMFRNQLAVLPENVMSRAEFQSTFFPVIYTDLNTAGGLVGMPLMIDGLGLYYNKEMFATAGIQPPRTWDQLRQAAQDLTIKSGNNLERGGIALGLTGNVDHFSDILALMLLQNGANPADPTSNLARDAIDYYRLFAVTDQVWSGVLPPSTYAFATERVAMIIAPSWRAHEIAVINPELDFAIVSVPQLPDSQVSLAAYWVEGVSNQSPNQAMAWKLLEFMSQPESLRKVYTRASQERLFGNPFPRVDMVDQLIGDEYAGAYIEQAAISTSWPMITRTFDNGLNDKIIKYYEDALNGGAGPTQLQTLSNGVTQVLSDYAVDPRPNSR